MRRSIPRRIRQSWPHGLLLAGALGAAAAGVTRAAEPETAADLPPAIDTMLPELALDPSQVGLYVRRVDADAPHLAVGARVARVPASVMKLVTSMAALDRLGLEYRWRTEVHRSGEIIDGRLHGDLIITGYGDPYLTNDDYAGLIRALRAKGIESIAGDLVIDASQLARPEADRDDFDGAGRRAYNALPASLSVNRQVTDLVVYHDRASGRVGIYTDPPLSGLDLVNEATVVQAPCQGRYHRLQVRFREPEGQRPRLEVSGRFASECPDERLTRLLLTPEQHAASAFHALWRQLGGRIDGQVLLAERPGDAALVHRIQSRPLSLLLRDLNKLSNNLMARLVFLELGVAAAGAPGTLAKSRAAVAEWLGELGIDTAGLVIDNGSGLSREARVSAAALGELLVYAWQQPWMPELVASLAIAGVDGTMRRRLRYEPIEGRAHLKTGTLRDASCIAGYVQDRDGRRWVVVVLVNAIEGGTLQAWRGHAMHHAVLRWVHEGAPLPLPDGESLPP